MDNNLARVYQPHIDGLRFIAVMSVILFHTFPKAVPGGFLGVDVFFVITGFLITGIIKTEVEQNRFSFQNFYSRRVRRILPAFFFMLFLVLLGGYFVSLPYEYYKIAISGLSSLFFLANMQFAFRTNEYFAPNSLEWPLLHTWSLSVEEQYYFVLPIFLLLAFRYLRDAKLIWIPLAILAITSFLLATFMASMPDSAKLSYYSLPTRFGEMMVGSLAVYVAPWGSSRNTTNALTLVAFATILSSFFLINIDWTFPGVTALPITLATALLLLTPQSIVSRFLSLPVFVYIGLLSYSLYLMHWPVLAFLRYLFAIDQGSDLTIEIKTFALAVTAALSLCSYYLVEIPLRRKKWGFGKTVLLLFLFPSILISSWCLYIIAQDGLPDRLSTSEFDANLAYNHIDKTRCPELVNLGCIGGDKNSEKLVVLFGNSHAQHYFSFVDGITSESGLRLELFAASGCTIMSRAPRCLLVKNRFDARRSSADAVIVAIRWDRFVASELAEKRLEQILSDLNKDEIPVILLGQPPKWKSSISKVSNCRRLFSQCWGSPTPTDDYPSYNIQIEDLAKRINTSIYLPFNHHENEIKPFDAHNRPLYLDDDHLSVYGSRSLRAIYANDRGNALETFLNNLK